jgi:hypothetical protein
LRVETQGEPAADERRVRVAFRLVEARGYTRAVGLFGRSEDDPKLVAAHAEAEGALPEGWKLAEEDRERFLRQQSSIDEELEADLCLAELYRPLVVAERRR